MPRVVSIYDIDGLMKFAPNQLLACLRLSDGGEREKNKAAIKSEPGETGSSFPPPQSPTRSRPSLPVSAGSISFLSI